MRSHVFLIVLISSIFLFLANGCDDSPITNNYYNNADSLNNPNILPKVIFTNPANGSVGPFYDLDPTQYYNSYRPLLIQFNKNIDRYNFGNNSITLKTENKLIYIYQPSDQIRISNILLFDAPAPYLAGKTYTLTIDTTFKDIHQNKLNAPYVMSFIPEPKFRLLFLYPSEKHIDPNNTTALWIKFNSPVDTSIFNSISITPHTNGSWQIGDNYSTDSLTLQFFFDDTLKFNTTYTVSITGNAKDKNGLVIDKAYQFSLKTDPFSVYAAGSNWELGPGGFYVYSDLYFRFNAEANPSTINNSITMSPNISFTTTYPYDGDKTLLKMHFNVSQYQRNTEYKINFKPTILSKDGDALSEYTYTFRTGR